MRMLPTLFKTVFLTFVIGATSAATADEIGKYTLTINGLDASYISEFIADTGAGTGTGKTYSDLAKMNSNSTEMIRVDAHTPRDEEQSELPSISLTLSGDASGYTNLMFIQLIDIDYETALTANDTLGQKHIENIKVGADGSISFDFSADLVRTSLEEETAIDGAAGAHIEGSYSGKIPASEMKE